MNKTTKFLVEQGVVTVLDDGHLRLTEAAWINMNSATAHTTEPYVRNLNGHCRYSKKDDCND